MPAPTALRKADMAPESVPLPDSTAQEDEVLLDASALPQGGTAKPPATEEVDVVIDEEGRPRFTPGKNADPPSRSETRKIPIPPHRMTPLKNQWPKSILKIYGPLVTHCKLQIRMNVGKKMVEIRSSKHTESAAALQQGADFVKAFALGFEVEDCVALLRLDNLYTQSFEIKDIKTLNPDAQSRAIGRIAGKDGKTRFAIENATKTRIVVAGSTVHILGAYENLGMARESIVSLVLGKTPGKVYNGLRVISSRMKERF